ncbi:MAG: hypothetical protein GQ532_19860 [Methylomarinum sp.]|nr:hypothetical protein [Methylomarinum sp.]
MVIDEESGNVTKEIDNISTLQFKVLESFKNEFKAYAAIRGKSMSALFIEIFEEYKEKTNDHKETSHLMSSPKNIQRLDEAICQIEIEKSLGYWARLGEIADENPDLPLSFIKDILTGLEETKAGGTN